MNASPPMPPVPPPAPRPFEPVVFWIAVVIGTLAAVLGGVAVYDATQPSGSGEWAGLGVLVAAVVDLPTALVVFGVAFTQRRRGRRAILVLVSLVLAALPFLTAQALQQRRAKQWRDMGKHIPPRETGTEEPK